MQLKKILAIIALFVFHAVKAASSSFLPSDFYLPQFGKLEDSVEIMKISEREYHLRQHIGGQPLPADAGTFLNFMAFCTAYGLSQSNSFSGWSMTMKPTLGEKPVERILVVLLSNGPDDLKEVASPKDWTGFVGNAAIRDSTCKNIVNPKYIK